MITSFDSNLVFTSLFLLYIHSKVIHTTKTAVLQYAY